ncbi:hypothetical protein BK716_07465 [Bacillus thuringiensis serovar higo]|uniref:Uncharacterized protein n=1 Tax=Bacillus thuringiensis subsp. higo TaxID=132266 RepID=A0A9X6QU89_BACUH|nr:hypothetical protein BK716_07465 [Bacillus thuringiensis serovar higo]
MVGIKKEPLWEIEKSFVRDSPENVQKNGAYNWALHDFLKLKNRCMDHTTSSRILARHNEA